MPYNPLIAGQPFPAEIIGSVEEDHDFMDVIDTVDAVEGIQVHRNRLFERWRMFAGTAATYKALLDAESVEGVKDLEYSGPVFAAKEHQD